MVGYSTTREILLWVQTTEEAKVKFEYWILENPGKKYVTGETTTHKQDAYVAKVVVGNLSPGKKYGYELFIDDKRVDRPYELSFQTQKLWKWQGPPPDFSFAFGSCAYFNDPGYDRPGKPYGGDYNIFNSIYNENPDFMLWGGDNVYLRADEWNSKAGFRYRYTHSRSVKEIQPLLGSVHNYAIWDDHEYGPNNAGGSFWNKNIAYETFRLFWGNPNTNVTGEGGITGTFLWGDVQFFLLDNRYFRTSNENHIAERTILGEAQFQWLIDALTTSRASFKFIVIGGQVLNPAAKFENYATYEKERALLIQSIREAKISGVIFLTGDRHHTELTKLDADGQYPLYDLTVSPLTSGPGNPRENNYLRVPGTLVTERNYGIIKISGPEDNRVLNITIKDAAGNEIWQKEITQLALQAQ